MTNNNFDKVMADILKGMKVPYDKTSWKRLERKLKDNDGEDAVFDKVIADKLKAHSVPVTGASFERFESRLNANSSNTQRSFRYYKLSGIAAAILLLISGYFYFNGTNSNNSVFDNSSDYSVTKTSNTNKEAIALDASNGNITEKGKDKALAKLNKPVEKGIISNTGTNPGFNQHKDVLLTKSTAKTSNSKYIGDFIVPGSIVSSPYQTNYGLTLAGLNKNLLLRGTYTESSFDLMDFVFKINIESEPNNTIASNNFDTPVNNGFLSENNNTKKLIAGNTVTNNITDTDKSIEKTDNAASDFMANTGHNTPTIESGMNTSTLNQLLVKASIIPTTDFINTPNDKILQIPGYNQVKSDIGAGLAISYKNNKHEFESGIDVMHLSYSPNKTISKSNQKSFYLDKIEYINIRIPLVHKYHISENKTWDIYSIAGIAANTLFKTKYTFVEKSLDGNGNEHVLKTFARELQDDFDFQNTLYWKKDYKKGIKEGARLKDNLFVSANIGLGIRRKFKKGLSLTFEPQYNHIFSKLGPNNDMINSLEFKLGISKTINL